MQQFEQEDELAKILAEAEQRKSALDQSQGGYDLGGAIQGGLASLGAAFQGGNSIEAANRVMAQRDQARKDERSALDKWKEGKIAEIKAKRDQSAYAREEDERKRNADLNSEESKIARALAKKMGYTGDLNALTAERFAKVSPALEKMLALESARAGRAAMADMRGQMLKESREREDDKRIEEDVQKLSSDIGNAQDIGNALAAVESKLGFKIDDAVTDDGSLKVKGKEVDLPGVNIPLIGRVSAYDGKARELQSALSKVFNVELKDRSGAAVTTPELERLKTEFAQGKFNTEPEMVRALADYRAAAQNALKNREAAYRPEVVQRYRDRGGFTSESMGSQPREKDPDASRYSQMHGIPYEKALEIITSRKMKKSIAGGP